MTFFQKMKNLQNVVRNEQMDLPMMHGLSGSMFYNTAHMGGHHGGTTIQKIANKILKQMVTWKSSCTSYTTLHTKSKGRESFPQQILYEFACNGATSFSNHQTN